MWCMELGLTELDSILKMRLAVDSLCDSVNYFVVRKAEAYSLGRMVLSLPEFVSSSFSS